MCMNTLTAWTKLELEVLSHLHGNDKSLSDEWRVKWQQSPSGIVLWETKFRCHCGVVLGAGLCTTQQAGRGGCWGQQVSVSETIHCALWALDWGYPLNNCSGCWNWFKVFRHIPDDASLPSPSHKMLWAMNNCIHGFLKYRSTGFLIPRRDFSHAVSQLNKCRFVCVFFWLEGTFIS